MPTNADDVYDQITDHLSQTDFRPRALFERFCITFLATTDGALDPLESHARLRQSGWTGRVVPTFRPDDVVDPDRPGFHAHVAALGELTGMDTHGWAGYLDALRSRRAAFVAAGATASDHGHPSPATADLPRREAEALFGRIMAGTRRPGDAEVFRGQMLVEMAGMSIDDGLALQIHAGAWRDHNPTVAARFGPDQGADIPKPVDFVGGLKPLLDRFGNEPRLTVIVYTLDETTYSRELAPLAGHYPALRLGPPWWFFDSPEGMRRFYRSVVETSGFANTVGFNDDARSLLSIPARHDVARRLNAGYLADLVAEHRMDESEAALDRSGPGPQPRLRCLRSRTMKQVVLVGLMGSGKSTVGSLVAARTGRVFVDVDIVIAQETGQTVRELWEAGGEASYRKLESEAVLRVLAGNVPSVLAAPGGVVLDPKVRAALAGNVVVWLRTRPTTLAGRVHVGDHRPLLGDRPAETLAVMADDARRLLPPGARRRPSTRTTARRTPWRMA